MLVLTRKRSEMIQIGDGIVVKIIHTGRNTVKLGIQAPANVRVLRGELCMSDAAAPLASVLADRRSRIEYATEEIEAEAVMAEVSSL